MSTTPEQIDVWRAAPKESQHLEFKEAKTQFDSERLFRYCVALANEGGGHLLFGIEDTPPRKVVGTAAVNDPIGMAAKLFNELGFRVEVEEVMHPDGRVVVFHVPSRLKGTAYNRKGTYYMRSGEELVPMSEDVLRKIFNEGAPDWLEEVSVAGLSAQDVIDKLDTQGFFDLLEKSYPSTREAVLDSLIRERLIEVTNGSYTIRRLGALLLAKNLEHFPDVARKAFRIIVYAGDSKLTTKLDQILTKGYAVGFRELWEFVMNQLPQNEVVEGALRRKVKLIPEDAVRELLANALIHQDFLIAGAGPVAELYTSRLEISNPGAPIVPVERFIDGYQSRNERLADLMRRMKICEERSSGIDRVVFTAEVYQLPAPKFEAGQNRTSVVVFGHRSFDEMDRSERVRATYQHCALKYVMRDRMTNQTLRERFKLPESKSASVSQAISYSVEAGLIKLDAGVGESRKYARYIPFWA